MQLLNDGNTKIGHKEVSSEGVFDGDDTVFLDRSTLLWNPLILELFVPSPKVGPRGSRMACDEIVEDDGEGISPKLY